MAEQAMEIMTATIGRVEDFLERMTIVVTDHIASLNDSSLLVVPSNDARYNLSIVAEWFHAIPHVDIRMRPLPANITFDPNDNEYLESLGILVALPGFWLIFTLLFFLIFFLCRCCDGSANRNGGDAQKQSLSQHNHNNHHNHNHNHQQQQLLLSTTTAAGSKPNDGRKAKRMTGCKLCLALIATVTGFAITVGLLGSVIAHRGMNKLHNSTGDIADVIETMQRNTRTVSSLLRGEVETNADQLLSTLDVMLVKDKDKLKSPLTSLKQNLSKGVRRVDEMRMDQVNIRPVPDTLRLIERVRWPATFGFAFVLAIFLLILLCGLVRHSRCTLIMFSVFGLLALVVGWVLASFYLGLLVAGADFCAEPDPFLADRFSTKRELQLFDHYMLCPIARDFDDFATAAASTSYDADRYDRGYGNGNGNGISGHNPANRMAQQHPFWKIVRDSSNAVERMSEHIRTFEIVCINAGCNVEHANVDEQIKTIVDSLRTCEQLLNATRSLLDCRRVHDDFAASMTSTCKDLIEGIFLMLATAIALGLLFTLLVLCASHTWIHIRGASSGGGGSNCSSTSITANSALSHASSSNLGTLDAANADETDPFLGSTPHLGYGGGGIGFSAASSAHQHQHQHHHTMLSNNSTTSSINASLGGKRFRDSYGSAYGTTGRGRFSHTPPQTPHFAATLGAASHHGLAASSSGATHGAGAMINTTAGRRSEEQLPFLSPPPAYDQLTQQQQQALHYQQQQQQHQHQHQQQQLQLQQQQQQQQHQHQQQQHQQQLQHGIYGTHQSHMSTLPHSHQHLQQHQHHHQQQQQQQQQMSNHPSAIGHYVSTKYY